MIEVDTGRAVERVSAEFVDDNACDSVLLFAHGAGANMHHEFMTRTAEALRANAIATLRFQFPYMERGRKPPDRQPVLTASIVAAAATAASLADGRPLFAGGKSMGGRMTSLAAAQQRLAGVSGLVFFGFPLHPAGKPSRDRAAHLCDITVPMLFLQGTRDRLADFELIEAVCSELKDNGTLHRLEGADHSFKFLKSAGRTAMSIDNEIAAAVRTFIERHRRSG